MKRFIGIIVSILILLLAVFPVSCDSIFSPEGTVYEWVNPPNGETGEVYVNSSTPDENLELLPLGNAHVSFFSAAGRQGLFGCGCPSKEFYPIMSDGPGISDSNGHFSDFATISPGKTYPMKISVEKTGYHPVEKIFTYDFDSMGDYSFTILLVREP